jgi:hypothetical protein
VANHSCPSPAAAPSGDQSKTYRANTGSVAFVPFTANSIEEAIEYVRQNQNPNYAGRRWLRVKENGMFVWIL